MLVLALCRPLLGAGKSSGAEASEGFDLAGAFLITTSILAAVYAIVGTETAGWASARTILIAAAAAALLVALVAVEKRSRAPLVPLAVFRWRNLTVSNVVMVLIVAGMFGWFFFSALYLQRVLGYDSLQIGLAYLPATLILGALSYSAAARVVGRFGVKPMMVVGMSLMALSLAFFARAPVDGSFALDVLPAMVLLGFGASFAFLTVILASVSGVPEDQAGPRLGPGQHLPADGRCVGARGAGQRRRLSDGGPARGGERASGRPERRLPRRFPPERDPARPRRRPRRDASPPAQDQR